MRPQNDLRKGKLVATVVSGAWRIAALPPLEITEAELDEVTPLLSTSGVAPLTWRRISETHLRNTPSAEVLHQTYRLQSLQSAIQEEKIERLFRLFREASVDAILIKGWAAAQLYPENQLRPYGDIDIFVRPEHWRFARAVQDSPEANDCWVDLHPYLQEVEERSVDELFDRSQLVRLGAEQVRILGLEDHLALLCIHLLKHGAWRPLWLCDISAALESLPSNFDWDIFLGSSRKRAGWVFCAIGLAQCLLGAKVEQPPLSVEQIRVPGWVVQTVLHHWSRLYPADQKPMRPPPLMVYSLRNRRKIITGISERWPDPITATFNMGGRFNSCPRFPYQFMDFTRAATQFLFELPSKLQSSG